MRLLRRCWYCGGRGWYTTGSWHFDGEPWDDIEEHDCPYCQGTGCDSRLWPVVWAWKRIRHALRWVGNMLQPAEGIPF